MRRPENVLFPDAVPSPEANVATSSEAAGGEGTSSNKPGRRSHADVLFGQAVLKDSVIDDNDRRVADHAGLAREQRDAEQETFDQVRQELNLTQAEARQLHGLVTEMRVNGTTEGWRREAATWPRHMRAQLRERHGSDSEKVAADVASYIEARPVLQTFLGELQHHPDVVAILSERTRRPWRYGRQG